MNQNGFECWLLLIYFEKVHTTTSFVCLALLVFTEASFPCRLRKSEQWQTARYFNALMTV